jgi:hypothetical protein
VQQPVRSSRRVVRSSGELISISPGGASLRLPGTTLLPEGTPGTEQTRNRNHVTRTHLHDQEVPQDLDLL